MSIKFLIIIITIILLYDTYHEHYYYKRLNTYKKYYKMIAIALFGLGSLTIINKKNDNINILHNFIKTVPLDKQSKDIITPFISKNTQERSIEKMNQSGKKSKRSVSETKKKFVASQQNWICGDCEEQLTAWFEVDHKLRLERGGTNELNNLVALCRNCHGKKTALENML